MRESDLLAPSRVGSPRGPRSHDGTIIPETVDTMWGIDLTTTITGEGQAAVFIALDHCSVECVGIRRFGVIGLPSGRGRRGGRDHGLDGNFVGPRRGGWSGVAGRARGGGRQASPYKPRRPEAAA